MSEAAQPRTQMNLDTNFLKVIAVISMTFDHVGKGFFPELVWMQVIGRIAFPIYAYCLVVGCLYTRDVKKYLLRLTVFAVLSQPFYAFSNFDNGDPIFVNLFQNINIFFTLVLGLFTVYCLSRKTWRGWAGVAAGIILSMLINFDYGIYGILMMLLFYLTRGNWKLSLPVMAAYMGAELIQGGDVMLCGLALGKQGFALLSLPFIYCKTNFRWKINKYFFYAFYPGHLLLIGLVKFFIR